MIWDRQTEQPATLFGVALIALGELEAEAMSALLNRATGDEAPAPPPSLRRAS